MTKFFQDKNPPRVWDRDLNKVTVVFQKGEFETEDSTLIDLLVRVGYRPDCVSTDIKSYQDDQKTMRTAKTKLVRMKNEPSKTN